MANDGRVGRLGWSRIPAILIVMGSVVAVAVATTAAAGPAEDVDKAKSPAPAKRKDKDAKLPEVIRTEEHEDVDGRTARPPASKSSPALKPAQLDQLILKGLAANNVPVSEATSDEEFIRRLYLDVMGRLPNPGEVREFVGAKAKNKRALLIDRLLEHPDFSENWARYWRDVVAFRSPNENDRQVNYPLFETWLKSEFVAKKPWDEIATAIITATGRNDENGAAVFAVAEEGSPVEMAGEVSRVFLGVQIQCAQCHDHPSDPWKRQQFHEFAAFFSGVKSRRAPDREKGKPAVMVVSTDGPAHYAMPDLKNPEKKVAVSPRFFLNEAPKVSEQVKPRRAAQARRPVRDRPRKPLVLPGLRQPGLVHPDGRRVL